MSITGVKTTPVIYKFQRMCISRFTKVRVVYEASRFRVKLLQTDPYFDNHILTCNALDVWLSITPFSKKKSKVW